MPVPDVAIKPLRESIFFVANCSGRAGCRPNADAPARLRVVVGPEYALTSLSARSAVEADRLFPKEDTPERESALRWEE